MKQNQSRLIKLLLILIAVFGVLILRSEFSNWWSKVFPEKTNLVFPGLKEDDFEEIRVTNNQITKIYNRNNEWLVASASGDFKADQERIGRIVDAFIKLRKENIASTNKNKHADLGIGNQKIEIKTENKSYVLFIGNTEGLDNNYVRVNDENEVFVAGGFAEVFTNDDFRDLSLGLVNEEDKINLIHISYNDSSTELEKNETNWKIGDKKAKDDRVNFYLNDLKTLKAQNILKREKNYSGINPELTITVKENNKEKNVSFYPETGETYQAIISSDNYEYVIPAAYVASLKKQEKDFIE